MLIEGDELAKAIATLEAKVIQGIDDDATFQRRYVLVYLNERDQILNVLKSYLPKRRGRPPKVESSVEDVGFG